MLTSIATVCLSGSLADKLTAIAAAGYQGVEVFENDLIASQLSPRQIGAMIGELGLVCTCYQPFRDFEGLHGRARAQAFDRAERKFDVMEEIGTDLLLVCSSVAPDADGDSERIADDFRELGDRALRRRLRVGYEALAWGRHVYDHRQAWDIVRKADHPAIGLILDTFHSLAREVPIESIADIDGEKIFLLQIADAPAIGMDTLFWSRHFRCFPGQGDFPIIDYVAAVAARGYDGPASLEIFNDRFRSWRAPQIATDGRRSLAWALDQIAPTAARMPMGGTTSGFQFVEFAAQGKDADRFEAVFRSLGFSAAGSHRTKQVKRWRQGDINLIVNSDPHGLANSHHIAHGPSVCALGIGVDDPLGVVERAHALGISEFSQPVAQTELRIPSIRGVGGALIYLTPIVTDEDFWAQDFVVCEETHDSGCGLLRVDHVAQSMMPEEFLSWLLFYVSLFGLKKTSPVDVADPSGLVQSQAVESTDGRLRITLNGAAGQTLVSRFVQSYFGAGVQHIAFETEDIFASTAAFLRNGVELLEPSDNYYVDLQAKFGLDAGRIEPLKQHRVFYDRDATGEYFQCYTRAIAKGIFFEIVERRHYAGYGAANAPVRLAAQARFGAPASVD